MRLDGVFIVVRVSGLMSFAGQTPAPRLNSTKAVDLPVVSQFGVCF